MKNRFLNWIMFWIRNRFIIILLFLIIIFIFNYHYTGNIFPTTDTKNLWFYSGLFMILFSILFIEPYYNSPKNVITNIIPLLLVFLPIRGDFKNKVLWIIIFSFLLFLLFLSILSMILQKKEESPGSKSNIFSNYLTKTVTTIGSAKILFSATFIIFLLFFYKDINNNYFLILILLWELILRINPNKTHILFSLRKDKENEEALGRIFGVQSKNIFLVKLFTDKKSSVKKFDLVEFKYPVQDFQSSMIGIIFDTYILDEEKWLKILQFKVKTSTGEQNHLLENIVYKVKDQDKLKTLKQKIKLDDFLGIVSENSTIEKIKFEYSQQIGKESLEEGDLLELEVRGKKVFYQVIAGTTGKEKLEKRNESGFIIGEAKQLGVWNEEEMAFEGFGWLPYINTPVFKADTSIFKIKEIKYPEYVLGKIPKTTLPSIINLDYARTHHLAILGVTGSGKSFIARKIIKKLSENGKIFIVDFTGEWKDKIKDVKFRDLIDITKISEPERVMAEKETKASKGKYADKQVLLRYKELIKEKIDEFMKTDDAIAMFEIFDFSNTSFILELTQLFMEAVFSYAKDNPGQKITILLEEAHTITPETNFLGDLGDYGSTKALVNKMGQIALQGRKYGVGLIVLAQRTANVSKTILTQCNTVICFKAFDETSFNFLSSYVGRDFIQSLPTLKQYHAIVAGKAIKSNVPMIIDLTDKVEE